MTEIHLIEILALANVVQLFFWGYHVHVLLNKAMSKSFAEYNLIKKGPPKVTTVNLVEDESEEASILSELNGIFPTRESAS